MEWLSALQNNWGLTILVIFSLFFLTAEVIKAGKVIKEFFDNRKNKADKDKKKELDMQSEFKALHDKLDSIDSKIDSLEARTNAAEERLKDLTISDMHDIKSWIVEQYHKFYVQQGWIDAFSAETIDRRYSDYQKEGGNSYISTMIDQLHTLSMDPSQSRHRKQENSSEQSSLPQPPIIKE